VLGAVDIARGSGVAVVGLITRQRADTRQR
jgi:hypothetical protein